MKQYLCAIIAGCLFGQATVVRADEASDFIGGTHMYAENLASASFHQILMDAFIQGLNVSRMMDRSALVTYIERLQSSHANLAISLTDLYVQGKSQEALTKTGSQLEDLYGDFLKIKGQYFQLRSQISQARQASNDRTIHFVKFANAFAERYDEYCATGISINPYDQVRAVLAPTLPPFSLFAGIDIGFDGSFTPRYDKVKADFGKPELTGAFFSVWGVASGAKLYYMLLGTGKDVTFLSALNGETWANLSAKQYFSAVGTGFLVALAVVAVIMAVLEAETRRKSEELVKDQRRIYQDKATHETVKALFQQKCERVRETVRGLPSMLKGIMNKDRQSLERYSELEKNNSAFMLQLEQVISAYIKKSNESAYTLHSQDSEEDKKKKSEELQKTEEAQNFAKLAKDVDPKRLAEVSIYALLNGYISSEAGQQKIEQSYQEALEGLSDEELRLKSTALRMITADQKKREWETNQLKALLIHQPKLSFLVASLDRLVLDFASLLFGRSLTRIDWSSIDKQILDIKNMASKILKTKPSHPVALHISEHLRTIEQIQAEVAR